MAPASSASSRAGRLRGWLLVGIASAILQQEASRQAAPTFAGVSVPINRLLAGRHPGRERESSIAACAYGTKPTTQDLTVALGRELWVAADELLDAASKGVATRNQYSPVIAICGISLRNAADMMCDGNWEEVMGQLEDAVASGQDVFPDSYMTGLVNLFSYYEECPECEWAPASQSCTNMANHMLYMTKGFIDGVEGRQKQEALKSMAVVVERFQAAAKLFQPGGFNMPVDPRDDVARQGRGGGRAPGGNPFMNERSRDPSAMDKKMMAISKQATYMESASLEANDAGAEAQEILEQVKIKLTPTLNDPAGDQRQSLLRKLVRELHPDVNPERIDAVRPSFELVQNLRDLA